MGPAVDSTRSQLEQTKLPSSQPHNSKDLGSAYFEHASEQHRSRLRIAGVAVALAVLATGFAALVVGEPGGPHQRGRSARGHQNAKVAQTAPTQRGARHLPSRVPPGYGLTAGVGVGVYAGAGNVAGAHAFQDYLGFPVRYAMDFLSNASWSTIADPAWTLAKWAGSGFQRIWGVPMLPASGATLALGATGAYDSYFNELAKLLVQHGQQDAILVLGWDADLPGLPWSATTPAGAAQYVTYWRDIVTSMRAVPGAHFRFEWDAAQTSTAISPESIYPGNAYVDIIATDVLQQELTASSPPSGAANLLGTTTTAAERWAVLLNVDYGLTWFAEFASTNHKPLAIAKWGLAPQAGSPGGNDDPYFVQHLLKWMTAHAVKYGVVWDYGSWSITSGAFPLSAAALRNTLRSLANAAPTPPAA